jgi:hypothetical protein
VVSVETKDTDMPTSSSNDDPTKPVDDTSEGASVHSMGNRGEIDEEEDLISGKFVGLHSSACLL